MAGIGLPPRRNARADAAVSDLRPGLDRGRPGHFRPLSAASPGEREPDHLQSRASPAAFDASWWASLGVAGPGGRMGPLPRRCSQCRPPGRARRPPLPTDGLGHPRGPAGRGRSRPAGRSGAALAQILLTPPAAVRRQPPPIPRRPGSSQRGRPRPGITSRHACAAFRSDSSSVSAKPACRLRTDSRL